MNCSPHLTGLQKGLRHGIPGKPWMVPLKVLQGELENNLAWGIPGDHVPKTTTKAATATSAVAAITLTTPSHTAAKKPTAITAVPEVRECSTLEVAMFQEWVFCQTSQAKCDVQTFSLVQFLSYAASQPISQPASQPYRKAAQTS